ncbi:MAG: hypothetical protein AAGA30_07515 [Planctomycetota bacterium]
MFSVAALLIVFLGTSQPNRLRDLGITDLKSHFENSCVGVGGKINAKTLPCHSSVPCREVVGKQQLMFESKTKLDEHHWIWGIDQPRDIVKPFR